jgi:hypothetical protein
MALTCDEIGNAANRDKQVYPAPLITGTHIAFRDALLRHHKAERDRTEKCLGSIINLVTDSKAKPETVIDGILLLLVEHYTR